MHLGAHSAHLGGGEPLRECTALEGAEHSALDLEQPAHAVSCVVAPAAQFLASRAAEGAAVRVAHAVPSPIPAPAPLRTSREEK